MRISPQIVSLSALISFSCVAFASTNQLVSADNYGVIQKIIKKSTTNAEDTLLVFDIDDTLLATKTDFGGTAWYNWQSGMLKQHSTDKMLIADNLDALLQKQKMIFKHIQMVPSEKNVPLLIRDYKKQHYNVLIETARGPFMADITEAALEQNHIEAASLGTKEKLFALSSEPCRLLVKDRLDYDDGVYYVGGQNKGLALDCFLRENHQHFKKIIFIDDSKKNVTNMCNSFKQEDTDLTCIHYTHYTADQNDFMHNAKKQRKAYHEWRNFAHTHKLA